METKTLNIEKQVNEVARWLKTQPQLPQNIDKHILRMFVSCMHGNMEEAKKLIEIHYQMRYKYDHIFLKRDPMDESSQNIQKAVDFLELPGKTPDNFKIMMYRLLDYDSEKFNFTDSVKMLYMTVDNRFINYGNDEVSGEITIFDMAGFSLRHLTRTSIGSLRIFLKFIQEAHPMRLQGIHLLNAPSYVDKIMGVFRPFMKSELMKLMHFHLPDADTPYEYFSRDMLPEEYGGKAGKLCDLREYWHNKLRENRQYIMDESRWKIDKSKKSTTDAEIIECITKLEID